MGNWLRSDCGLIGMHLGCEHYHTTPTPRCWRRFGGGILSVAEAIHQRLLLAATDLDHCAINEMRQIGGEVTDRDDKTTVNPEGSVNLCLQPQIRSGSASS